MFFLPRVPVTCLQHRTERFLCCLSGSYSPLWKHQVACAVCTVIFHCWFFHHNQQILGGLPQASWLI